jgi:nitroimidazol reductase NimA-like FMN-containing flavoprotein (pyridoxamine 5'-phosphate oxidase superfamily)
MIGALDATEMDQILRRQQIGRLGVYGDGRVYIFPVGYGYDGVDLYVHSHEGLKVRLARSHPEVCFEVEDITSMTRWRTVMVHGRFEELEDKEERAWALRLIARQGVRPAPRSLAPYADGPYRVVVYRIRVDEVTGRYEYEPSFAGSAG